MSSSLLQQLNNSGELVLWHDYRLGNANDLSNYRNNGTASSSVIFSRSGARFTDANSKIDIPFNSSLALSEFSMIWSFGDSLRESANFQRLIYNPSDGINIYFESTPRIAFAGNTVERVPIDLAGSDCIGVNGKSGSIPILYSNGIYKSDFSDAVSWTANSGITRIGARTSLDHILSSFLSAVVIVNRQLTATEHSRIYGELARHGYPKP